MTEEQTKFLYSIADNMGTTGIEDFTCKDGETMREIIKAQEQPTSDDCVSRKAVAEIINKQRFGIHQISMGIIKEKIESLSPVTPTRKVGKWIEEPNCWLRCSCCNSHYPHTSIYAIKGSNYCPNCGADMRGSENE